MTSARIAGLALLVFSLAGSPAAAQSATLADAAEQRNHTLVRSLLDGGADVNASQVDGMTALHWAVYHDDTETAGLLMRSRANVNATNRYGVAPLFLACTNGNASLVKMLLDAGANANASVPGGETVLMTAARTGNIDAVKALLARGANPNAQERRHQTALMWAAAEGHTAVVRALIEAGAAIDATIASGFTPLFFAVREGHIDAARALLDAGVKVNDTIQPRDDRSASEVIGKYDEPVRKGTSPLLMAVENGHFELAIALVEAGANPNDLRSGFTPLHAISWVRKPDASDGGDPPPIGSGRLTSLQFARALVERGANVNARLGKDAPRPPASATLLRSEGATPFLLAADRADIPFMRELLKLGADPFLPNADNSTPLMAAAGLGTANPLEEAGTEAEALDAVKLLLELGADVNAVDSNGDTTMHGAAYGNFPTIVQLLAERGADIQIWKQPDTEGRTPLFIAEGYKAGRPQPSRPTIEVIQRLMVAAGLPTGGPRPRIRDIYEKVPEPAETARKP